MDKSERIARLHQELSRRKTAISLVDICALLECSESTAKRTLRALRNRGAPIYHTPNQGYRYSPGTAFELPSIWFSHEELQALLIIQKLVNHLSGGFFRENLQLVQRKVTKLLGKQISDQGMQRIRLLATGARSKSLPHFSIVASAVIDRRKLMIHYASRQSGVVSKREVSPQRLVFYKGNWYLDTWCHQADDFRSFAVEKIQDVKLLRGSCKHISEQELDLHFATSFGIFAGKPTALAVLRFSAFAAAWVKDEEWFPGLEGKTLDDGRLELRIPYHNPTELIMEICRYGADVEVVAPPELRRQVLETLQKAAAQYT